MVKLNAVAKALVAAFAALTGTLVTATTDGTFSTGDGVTVALAVLGALGITYAVPNGKSADAADGPKHAE